MSKVLIVRHGAGRGRIPRYLQPTIDQLRIEAPIIRSMVRVYETGDPSPDFSGIAAVLFLLGDPLETLYPDCHADAMRVYEEALDRQLTIVNPPTVLARYRKRDQAATWAAHGLPTPAAEAYDDCDALQSILARAEFPLLLRADADHCMTNIVRVRDRAHSRRLGLADVPMPGIATPWIDVRRGYPTRGPDRIWGTLYHKMRAYVWGDEVVPDCLYFSRRPAVCRENSMFTRVWEHEQFGRRHVPGRRLRGGWKRIARRRCWVPDIYDREIEFSLGPAPHSAIFKEAAASLGLGFVAFDYSTLSDGTPILWEANPYPNIERLDKGIKGSPRRRSEVGARQRRALGRFLQQLAISRPIGREDCWGLQAVSR